MSATPTEQLTVCLAIQPGRYGPPFTCTEIDQGHHPTDHIAYDGNPLTGGREVARWPRLELPPEREIHTRRVGWFIHWDVWIKSPAGHGPVMRGVAWTRWGARRQARKATP